MQIVVIGAGLCRARVGRLFRGFRPSRSSASTTMPSKIEALKRGEIPIFEPGLARPGRQQCRGRAADLSRPISPTAVAAARRGLHRRRHAVAARRRPRRPHLCLRRGARDRRRARRLHRHRHQIDRAGRHRRRGRARSSARPTRTPTSRSSPTRNSCAKARRSRTSSGPTASSSASRTSARGR